MFAFALRLRWLCSLHGTMCLLHQEIRYKRREMYCQPCPQRLERVLHLCMSIPQAHNIGMQLTLLIVETDNYGLQFGHLVFEAAWRLTLIHYCYPLCSVRPTLLPVWILKQHSASPLVNVEQVKYRRDELGEDGQHRHHDPHLLQAPLSEDAWTPVDRGH